MDYGRREGRVSISTFSFETFVITFKLLNRSFSRWDASFDVVNKCKAVFAAEKETKRNWIGNQMSRRRGEQKMPKDNSCGAQY